MNRGWKRFDRLSWVCLMAGLAMAQPYPCTRPLVCLGGFNLALGIYLARFASLLLGILALNSGCIDAAQGVETNRAAASLRPVYLIGHGANTLTTAREYLEA